MPNLSGRAIGGKLLRPIEVQALLGVGATALWNYVRAGVLTPAQHTPGGHARYREAEVLALVDELAEVAA